MKQLSTKAIRELFLQYFESNQHTRVQSASLIPQNDPTLLFVNAGMVPFKNYFLGADLAPYECATSAQRCVRAGGKHNDLENVGYTARHHTFFEMLGNFSFGAYFKRRAIEFAWNFLTIELGIPKHKLWVSVYKDDKESEAIWVEHIGVDPERVSRCGEKDNFWAMGDTGPCGPCTEIFYDHGPEIAGGPPGSPGEDGDRYIEIWNVVFMQYNRDSLGNLTELPKPCVDTGMGLERIAAVMQGVHNNYDIDLFQGLLKSLADISGCDDLTHTSMRVVVDHIRSCAFLITDGVTPSNEGRGYVLRRIIRRAVRHGYKLGIQDTFFYRLVAALVAEMGVAYPELAANQTLIEDVLRQEEQQFAETLSKGLKIFEQAIVNLPDNKIPGQVIFQLYDTYGFPVDLTADIARERALVLDLDGFERAMDQQRQQSKQANQFSMDYTKSLFLSDETVFTGYDYVAGDAEVTSLLQDGQPVTLLHQGEKGAVVLNQSPFYAESGGQVGDSGYLYFEQGCFRVLDTKKHNKAFLHIGQMDKGELNVGDAIQAEVDPSRQDIRLNHSATHLLHAALRRVLGKHVQQKGSLVDARRLRFDFSHSKALTVDQLAEIERLVNQQIRANYETCVVNTDMDSAKDMGAIALFGEKYGDEVRVIQFGDFSTELCGGTHVDRTGDIGLFKITLETASASGIRRIEAVTGDVAIGYVAETEQQLTDIARLLKTDMHRVYDRIQATLQQLADTEKELSSTKQRLASQQGKGLVDRALKIADVNVLAVQIANVDRATLRNTLDQLKQDLAKCAIVLATVNEDQKVELVAGISKDCVAYFTASDLLKQVTQQIGGKGGGKPELAQGGGDRPELLEEALNSIPGWVDERISVKG